MRNVPHYFIFVSARSPKRYCDSDFTDNINISSPLEIGLELVDKTFRCILGTLIKGEGTSAY